MKQRDKNRLIRYFNATPKSLYDCYKNPSKIKQEIYNDIRRDCIDDNGTGLKIISANAHQFSAGYLLTINGEEFLKYYTKSETQLIPTKPFYQEADK